MNTGISKGTAAFALAGFIVIIAAITFLIATNHDSSILIAFIGVQVVPLLISLSNKNKLETVESNTNGTTTAHLALIADQASTISDLNHKLARAAVVAPVVAPIVLGPDVPHE